MKYAFVSDLHANLQAWKAVYEDIQSNSVDRVVCLGDAVGYGPQPAEIVEALRFKVDVSLMGNHDAAVCGKLDTALFNDDARKLIEWTQTKLSAADRRFLETFPLTLIGEGFMCAHGDFLSPGNFNYILEANDALDSWKATTAPLLLVGHTHEPALYILGASGTPRTVEPQDFAIDPGKRYLVNVGSVGDPRGADHRASYCIYDTETASIYWRRVAFDTEASMQSMKKIGVPLEATYYTSAVASTDTPAPRTVFTPPKSGDKAAHDVVTVQDMKNVPPRRKKIPLNLISAGVFIALILSLFVWKRTHPALDYQKAAKRIIPSSAKTILPTVREKVEPGEEIPGWITHVDNRYRQAVGVNLDTFGMPFYYFTSERENDGVLLASPLIAVESNQIWAVDASFQTRKVVTGEVALAILLVRDNAGKPLDVPDFFVRIPAKESGGWIRLRERFTIPAGGTHIQFQVRGKFKGTALVQQIDLSLAKQESAGEADQGRPGTSPSPEKDSKVLDPWKMKVK